MRKLGLRAAGRQAVRVGETAHGRLLSGSFLSAVHFRTLAGIFADGEQSRAAIGGSSTVRCSAYQLCPPLPEATPRYREVVPLVSC